jgi:hypothetical protein
MERTGALTDPKEILPIIFGGKSTFTLHSTHSGNRYTYMVEAADKRGPNEIPLYFVKVLTGPDNTSSFDYIGVIFGRRTFQWTKKSKLPRDANPVKHFQLSLERIIAHKIPSYLLFIPSSHCARCGLTLTVTSSVLAGFGPKCAELVGAAYGGYFSQPVNSNPMRRPEPQLEPATFRHERNAAMGAQVREALAPAVKAPIQFPAPQQKYDGGKLREIAEPVRQVSDAEIEQAIKGSTEDFTRGGLLSPKEAHAVAFMKFKHQLSKARG